MANEAVFKITQKFEYLCKEKGLSEELLCEYAHVPENCFYEDIDYDTGKKLTRRIKSLIEKCIFEKTGRTVWQLEKFCKDEHLSLPLLESYYGLLKLEAPYILDSYMLYLEKNRNVQDRFYLPKRKQFAKFGLVDAMQDLEDDRLDLLSLSLPPGTGKTTLAKFFASWVIGRHPEDYSLFFSHSAEITDMFYRGVLDITTNEIEYLWQTVFPSVHLHSTNAKAQTINFDKYKPFANLQCTSVGAKNAGKVRCNRYLLNDDLIGGIEEALNKAYLDKLWRIYTTDARQRKLNQDVKEIHIATRWSVKDVIGRLQEMYKDNPRARFIAVPDIDEKTGESNFDYDYNGMSKQFFCDQALTMDEITYRCLYKNEPVEREGLLYHEEDLRRYLELPLREPDAIVGVCDTKAKGTDFFVLPVMYQYDEDYYMVDCMCDNGSDFGLQYGRIANLIIDYNMQQVEFESNSGGDRVAYEVERLVNEAGGRCNITTKPTETNKETRIIVNSDWIKRHVLFKTAEQYTIHDDYGVFMKWLLSYSVVGKTEHDDVPDCLSNFALFVTRKVKASTVEVIDNPFRRGGNFW